MDLFQREAACLPDRLIAIAFLELFEEDEKALTEERGGDRKHHRSCGERRSKDGVSGKSKAGDRSIGELILWAAEGALFILTL